jgi:hypothetical protein
MTGHGRSSKLSRRVFPTLDLPDTEIEPRLLDRFYAAGERAVDLANVCRQREECSAREAPCGSVLAR